MKKTFNMSSVMVALLAVYPVLSSAAVPTSGAYVDDHTDQYVADRASEVLKHADSVLCYMAGMAPEQMIGEGAYVAMIDKNKCESNSGGGKSSNKGAKFEKAIVESVQPSGEPAVGKVWMETDYNTINAKLVTTKEPSATMPYGAFEMNWCGTAHKSAAGSCDLEKGYIKAGTTGLTFFSTNTESADMGSMGGGTITATFTNSLTLNAVDADNGSGALSLAIDVSGGGAGAASMSFGENINIDFAYNATHFLRSENSGVTLNCFDRALAHADKSAWMYGLYDSTGARLELKSGFPIEFTDTAGVLHNGYVGYWGLWTDSATAPANGTTLTQIDYGSAGAAPTKNTYKLMQTGGKLKKHTATSATLAAVDKQRFWFGTDRDLETAGVPASATYSWTQYEVYWDDAAGQFFVSGKQDATSMNMQTLKTPVAIANADMVTAAQWGLNAWSNAGSWTVDSAAMANLATTGSKTAVLVVTEDIVYPSDFAAIGDLKCVFDCPEVNPSTGYGFSTVSDFNTLQSNSWTTGNAPAVLNADVATYKLDATSGNLKDATGTTEIINTAAGSSASWSQASGFMGSGKLLDATTLAGVTQSTAGQYSQADLDAVTTFYTWESSPDSWNQLSLLTDATTGVPVKFEPPIKVNFTVPANTDTVNNAPYGDYAGVTMSLEYGGFGDLWGIPTSCVDMATNTPCDFTASKQGAFNWKPEFTIPFGTDGVVTTKTATYYVKPLVEEVRFKKVDSKVCSDGGLTLPATAPGLPKASGWTDPALGAVPTLTEANMTPRVMHGVKKY